MNSCIIWFRRDLRLYDNPALHWACQNSDRVIPVYIHAEQEEQPWAPGGASRWWLHNSLEQLQQALKGFDLDLLCFSGASDQVLLHLADRYDATHVVFNRLYEPHLHQRDERLIQRLQARDIGVQSFDSKLLFKPGSLLNKQDLPYRVYTPFYRTARSRLESLYGDYRPLNADRDLHRVQGVPGASGLALSELRLIDEHPWSDKLHDYWQPGEAHAHELLDRFLDHALDDYPNQRDIPAEDGTSRLSPCLHFGEISPQQILHVLQPLLSGARGSRASEAAERFLSQLIWREFAHHILWHYPNTSDTPMDSRYAAAFWRRSKKDLERWRRGDTGVPLVDAGMKQLWETGWMHNRVRMVVASFLTKNLGLSWLEGARWFWDTLVDADLANNSMGWQWVAGCGVDAAPYYRIFNPETQTQRFDGQLRYIDYWRPEHRELDYPQPMVDLADSRARALQRYKQTINAPG